MGFDSTHIDPCPPNGLLLTLKAPSHATLAKKHPQLHIAFPRGIVQRHLLLRLVRAKHRSLGGLKESAEVLAMAPADLTSSVGFEIPAQMACQAQVHMTLFQGEKQLCLGPFYSGVAPWIWTIMSGNKARCSCFWCGVLRVDLPVEAQRTLVILESRAEKTNLKLLPRSENSMNVTTFRVTAGA